VQALSVLVIDDEISVQELLAEYLRGRGHAVAVAPTVMAATSALAEQAFDAVLTEMELPDGHGVEVLRLARPRGIPCLVVAAPVAAEDIVLAYREGASDVTIKPVRLRSLHDTLLRTVEGGRAARSAAARLALLDACARAQSSDDLALLEASLAALPATVREDDRAACARSVALTRERLG
jgi:DNA-binding NtrC family response regulator